VREIGRVSPSQVGCDTFGIGKMHESFHTAGNVPEVRDVLKMVATGSQTREQIPLIYAGVILSGPWKVEEQKVSCRWYVRSG
jgi:hypothetical protein